MHRDSPSQTPAQSLSGTPHGGAMPSMLKRVALIALFAILLRAALVLLYRQLLDSDAGMVGMLVVFSLPALELLALLVVVVSSMTSWGTRDEIKRFGINMLLVVMINAFLQIVDWARMSKTCEGLDFHTAEALCEPVLLQSFCNIPFVLIGALVLWVWKHRV